MKISYKKQIKTQTVARKEFFAKSIEDIINQMNPSNKEVFLYPSKGYLTKFTIIEAKKIEDRTSYKLVKNYYKNYFNKYYLVGSFPVDENSLNTLKKASFIKEEDPNSKEEVSKKIENKRIKLDTDLIERPRQVRTSENRFMAREKNLFKDLKDQKKVIKKEEKESQKKSTADQEQIDKISFNKKHPKIRYMEKKLFLDLPSQNIRENLVKNSAWLIDIDGREERIGVRARPVEGDKGLYYQIEAKEPLLELEKFERLKVSLIINDEVFDSKSLSLKATGLLIFRNETYMDRGYLSRENTSVFINERHLLKYPIAKELIAENLHIESWPGYKVYRLDLSNYEEANFKLDKIYKLDFDKKVKRENYRLIFRSEEFNINELESINEIYSDYGDLLLLTDNIYVDDLSIELDLDGRPITYQGKIEDKINISYIKISFSNLLDNGKYSIRIKNNGRKIYEDSFYLFRDLNYENRHAQSYKDLDTDYSLVIFNHPDLIYQIPNYSNNMINILGKTFSYNISVEEKALCQLNLAYRGEIIDYKLINRPLEVIIEGLTEKEAINKPLIISKKYWRNQDFSLKISNYDYSRKVSYQLLALLEDDEVLLDRFQIKYGQSHEIRSLEIKNKLIDKRAKIILRVLDEDELPVYDYKILEVLSTLDFDQYQVEEAKDEWLINYKSTSALTNKSLILNNYLKPWETNHFELELKEAESSIILEKNSMDDGIYLAYMDRKKSDDLFGIFSDFSKTYRLYSRSTVENSKQIKNYSLGRDPLMDIIYSYSNNNEEYALNLEDKNYSIEKLLLTCLQLIKFSSYKLKDLQKLDGDLRIIIKNILANHELNEVLEELFNLNIDDEQSKYFLAILIISSPSAIDTRDIEDMRNKYSDPLLILYFSFIEKDLLTEEVFSLFEDKEKALNLDIYEEIYQEILAINNYWEAITKSQRNKKIKDRLDYSESVLNKYLKTIRDEMDERKSKRPINKTKKDKKILKSDEGYLNLIDRLKELVYISDYIKLIEDAYFYVNYGDDIDRYSINFNYYFYKTDLFNRYRAYFLLDRYRRNNNEY